MCSEEVNIFFLTEKNYRQIDRHLIYNVNKMCLIKVPRYID